MATVSNKALHEGGQEKGNNQESGQGDIGERAGREEKGRSV